MKTFTAEHSGKHKVVVDTSEPVTACLYVNSLFIYMLDSKLMTITLKAGDDLTGYDRDPDGKLREIEIVSVERVL